MSDLKQAFLDGMSCVAATVNVVATDGPAGRAGVTVSAMSSVSADTDKPVLLVCVNDLSAGATPIVENGVFAVNILRDDQSFVSDTFAGRYGDKGEEKFACAEWQIGSTGAPVLHNALASFDCRLIEDRIVGQHHVLFGEVQEVRLADRGRPLIYAQRAYSTAISLTPVSGKQQAEEADRLCVACLASFAPLHLPNLLAKLREKHPELQVDVIEGDQAQVAHLIETGEAHIGLLYDRDIPANLDTIALQLVQPHALFGVSDPLAEAERVDLAEIANAPLVLLDQPLSRDYVADLFASIERDPNIIARSSSFELVRSMVGNGLGYSILVTKPAADVSYDGMPLIARPIRDASAPMSIALARSGQSAREAEAIFEAECKAHFGID